MKAPFSRERLSKLCDQHYFNKDAVSEAFIRQLEKMKYKGRSTQQLLIELGKYYSIRGRKDALVSVFARLFSFQLSNNFQGINLIFEEGGPRLADWLDWYGNCDQRSLSKLAEYYNEFEDYDRGNLIYLKLCFPDKKASDAFSKFQSDLDSFVKFVEEYPIYDKLKLVWKNFSWHLSYQQHFLEALAMLAKIFVYPPYGFGETYGLFRQLEGGFKEWLTNCEAKALMYLGSLSSILKKNGYPLAAYYISIKQIMDLAKVSESYAKVLEIFDERDERLKEWLRNLPVVESRDSQTKNGDNDDNSEIESTLDLNAKLRSFAAICTEIGKRQTALWIYARLLSRMEDFDDAVQTLSLRRILLKEWLEKDKIINSYILRDLAVVTQEIDSNDNLLPIYAYLIGGGLKDYGSLRTALEQNCASLRLWLIDCEIGLLRKYGLDLALFLRRLHLYEPALVVFITLITDRKSFRTTKLINGMCNLEFAQWFCSIKKGAPKEIYHSLGIFLNYQNEFERAFIIYANLLGFQYEDIRQLITTWDYQFFCQKLSELNFSRKHSMHLQGLFHVFLNRPQQFYQYGLAVLTREIAGREKFEEAIEHFSSTSDRLRSFLPVVSNRKHHSLFKLAELFRRNGEKDMLLAILEYLALGKSYFEYFFDELKALNFITNDKVKYFIALVRYYHNLENYEAVFKIMSAVLPNTESVTAKEALEGELEELYQWLGGISLSGGVFKFLKVLVFVYLGQNEREKALIILSRLITDAEVFLKEITVNFELVVENNTVLHNQVLGLFERVFSDLPFKFRHMVALAICQSCDNTKALEFLHEQFPNSIIIQVSLIKQKFLLKPNRLAIVALAEKLNSLIEKYGHYTDSFRLLKKMYEYLGRINDAEQVVQRFCKHFKVEEYTAMRLLTSSHEEIYLKPVRYVRQFQAVKTQLSEDAMSSIKEITSLYLNYLNKRSGRIFLHGGIVTYLLHNEPELLCDIDVFVVDDLSMNDLVKELQYLGVELTQSQYLPQLLKCYYPFKGNNFLVDNYVVSSVDEIEPRFLHDSVLIEIMHEGCQVFQLHEGALLALKKKQLELIDPEDSKCFDSSFVLRAAHLVAYHGFSLGQYLDHNLRNFVRKSFATHCNWGQLEVNCRRYVNVGGQNFWKVLLQWGLVSQLLFGIPDPNLQYEERDLIGLEIFDVLVNLWARNSLYPTAEPWFFRKLNDNNKVKQLWKSKFSEKRQTRPLTNYWMLPASLPPESAPSILGDEGEFPPLGYGAKNAVR